MKKLTLLLMLLVGTVSVSFAETEQECHDKNHTYFQGRCVDDCSRDYGPHAVVVDNRCKNTKETCAKADLYLTGDGSCAKCPSRSPLAFKGGCVELTQENCNKLDRVLRFDGCRACPEYHSRNGNACEPTPAFCNNKNQILNGYACESCSVTQIRNGNVCETTVASCNNNDLIFVEGVCQSCSESTPVRVGNECVASVEICDAQDKIFRDGECRACPEGYTRKGNHCTVAKADCHAENKKHREYEGGSYCEDCPEESPYLVDNTCLTKGIMVQFCQYHPAHKNSDVCKSKDIVDAIEATKPKEEESAPAESIEAPKGVTETPAVTVTPSADDNSTTEQTNNQ